MQRILRLIYIERYYFIEELTGNLKKVFYSNLFQTFSSSLSAVFINAFIWRTTGSLLNIVLYSAGECLFLPIAFFLNGLLLGKVNIRTAFWIGAIGAGLNTALVVFLGITSPYAFFIYGCLWGIGNGFYWANRNYLELQESSSSQRKYFYSLLSIAGKLSGIIVPLFAGWFIVFGQSSNLYSPIFAYWILFAFSILLMLGGAFTISRGSFESPLPLFINRLKIRPIFTRRRILSLAQGFTDNLGFVSTLLILIFFGKEDVLGSITALVSIITIGVIYLYGRVTKNTYQSKILRLSSLGFSFCAFYLAFSQSSTSALVYILFASIFMNFLGLAMNPTLMSLTESELGNNPLTHRYSFIFDNELFLNIGRLTSMIFVLVFILSNHPVKGLLYVSLFAGVSQILLITFFRSK